jgi:lysophospholipase D
VLNINLIEIDVQLTKDGTLIVMHDTNLTRLFNKRRKVYETNYEDFGEIVPHYYTDWSLMFNYTVQPHDDRKVAKLEDFFKALPETRVSLELKNET